jgi:hypothetical protein
VFHFRPEEISSCQIESLSRIGRENEILNLGPFSKADIVDRVNAGEAPRRLPARSPFSVSISRRTREPDSSIEVRGLVDVLAQRLDSLRG